MAIYYKECNITLLFNDNEIVTEDTKKVQVSKFNIAIKIRDWTDGRNGGTSKHPNTPSIKVVDYGHNKSNSHSKDGDPVIFIVTTNSIEIDYNKKQFHNDEIDYIINFIKHNRFNLHNYWYSPNHITNNRELEEYQDKVQKRLIENIKKYNYKKELGEIDEAISY